MLKFIHEEDQVRCFNAETRFDRSRSKAQKLVIAGQVRVDGELVVKPVVTVSPDSEVTIAKPLEFVGVGVVTN